MEGRDGLQPSGPWIGVAGRCATDEEKSYVKQAIFLLRYRMKFEDGLRENAASPPQKD